jgi:hypothetical protein
VIRRDYAKGRRPAPLARPAPEPPQRPWSRLARGLVPGLLLGAFVAWLLLRHHTPAQAANQAATGTAAASAPAVAGAAAPVKVALPPRQPSTYSFYGLLTRDKAGQQAEPPKQP